MSREIVERADFPCSKCGGTKYFQHKRQPIFTFQRSLWRNRLECVNCGADFTESSSHPEPNKVPGGHFDCL